MTVTLPPRGIPQGGARKGGAVPANPNLTTPRTGTTPAPAPTPPPVVPPAPAPTDPNGTFTAYNPKPGTDPEWDAFMANYINQIAQANADATRSRSRLQNEYDTGIAGLQLAQPGKRKGLEDSLLGRGVGRSGYALTQRAGVESDYLDARNAADRARLEGLAGVDSTLSRGLFDLSADRENQIAQSRLRLGSKAPTPDTPGYDEKKNPKPKTTLPPKKPAGPGPAKPAPGTPAATPAGPPKSTTPPKNGGAGGKVYYS